MKKRYLMYHSEKKIYSVADNTYGCEKIATVKIIELETKTEVQICISWLIPDDFIYISDGRKFKEMVTPFNFDIHLKRVGEEQLKSFLPENTAVAYVDGSFNFKKKVCGSGVVFMHENKKEEYLSRSSSKKNIAQVNVGSELVSVIIAVQKAIEHNCNELIIYHDLAAIKEIADGIYSDNNEFFDAYFKYLNKAKENGLNIIFEKVKAHSGNWHNSVADTLAGAAAR